MAAPKIPASPAFIVNKLNAPVDDQGRTRPDLSEIFDDSSKAKIVKIDPAQLQKGSTLPVLGAVPWSFDLIATARSTWLTI
ncbi:phosphate acetyltransferase [Klebsiella pneumoniae subsp. rhinoscleromatis]|nr:phosphate acetyltransferase [Klebsiella pneumoniae subsp. rhinoscleromatis]